VGDVMDYLLEIWLVEKDEDGLKGLQDELVEILLKRFQ
jgi:hypothetical protein